MQQNPLLPTLSLLLLSLLMPGMLAAEALGPPGGDAPLLDRFVAGGMILGSPAVGRGGTVVFAADNRYLYAVSPGGTEKWRYDLREKATGILSLNTDGTAYAVTADGSISAVNDAGGRVWKLFGGGGFSHEPGIDDGGSLYLTTGEGMLYSVNHLGRVRWLIPLPGPVTAAPVIDTEGTVFLATAEPSISAVYPWSQVAWSRPLRVPVRVLAVGEGGMLITGDDRGVIVAWSGEGERLWSASAGSRISALAVLPGNTIAAGTTDGSLLLLGPDGERHWQITAGEGEVNGIAADRNGTLYSTLSGGSVTSHNPAGSELWNYRTGGVPGPPVLSREGVLYVGCSDWVLYSFHASPPAAGPWPLPRGTPSRNGRVDLPRRRLQVEEYFSRNLDYLYLAAFARSGEKEKQLAILDEIRQRYNDGSMGRSEPYLARILRYLASDELSSIAPLQRTRANLSPEVRLSAVRMLGGIASLRDRDYLVELTRFEWDPVVQAEAVRAMGELASDPEGVMSETVLRLVAQSSASGQPDERLGVAAIAAAEGISRYHGGAAPPQALEILQLIIRGSYPREIRSAALAAVRRISAARR